MSLPRVLRTRRMSAAEPRYVSIEVPASLSVDDLARAAREMRCTVRADGGFVRFVPNAEPATPIKFLPLNAVKSQRR